MTKTRKAIVIFTTLAILCSFFVVVFAVGNSGTEDEVLPSMANAYEYAQAPEGVYVFRYYGSDPSADLDIDTSECVVDRLYAYHSATSSVVEIFAQAVSDYTCTQTALYYVTAEQKVYKTDYTGTNHEYLYKCPQGAISMLSSYFDTLYFIEEQTRIMNLDTCSKVVQEIWAYEYLDWVFMLDDTQLIATTTEEEDYLYDSATDTATRVSNVVATNMVTAAVKGTSSNNARSITPNFVAMATQENNVSFPIEPYLATPDDDYSKVDGFYYSRPSSWFHNNGQEGCSTQNCTRYSGSGECKGFAKYVHDVYAHMVHDTSFDSNGNSIANDVADGLWEDRTCIIRHSYMNDANDIDDNTLKLWPSDSKANITRIQEFFEGLHTGAYVRYGKYLPVKSATGEIIVSGDDSPWNGCHSIVFIASDNDGIWVYECNQEYDGNSNHGCGVFIQYYTYVSLFRYKYILNYVNHNYLDALDYYDADYHTKGCTACVGSVRQEHTNVDVLSYVDKYNHRARFDCCGGDTYVVAHDDITSTIRNGVDHITKYHCCGESSAIVPHTGTVMCNNITATKHTVSASCCGVITEAHIYSNDPDKIGRCVVCNYEPVPGAELNGFENVEIN